MKGNSLEWLKAIRKRAGMTTYAVAQAVGISQSYYSLIENGAKTPTVPVAKRIAQLLLFPWTDFFRDPAA